MASGLASGPIESGHLGKLASGPIESGQMGKLASGPFDFYIEVIKDK